MIVPLFVGRDKSVSALEAAMSADKEIFLVAQLDPSEDDPERDDLYDIGVTATVLQLLKLPDGTVRVLVEGKQRATLVALEMTSDGYLSAEVAMLEGDEGLGELDDLLELVRLERLGLRLPPATRRSVVPLLPAPRTRHRTLQARRCSRPWWTSAR